MKQNLSREAAGKFSISQDKNNQARISSRYKVLLVAFIAAVVLAIGALTLLVYKMRASADIPAVPQLPTITMEADSSSTDVSAGDLVQIKVAVSNNSPKTAENLAVLSHGYNLSFQTGSDRALRKDELQKFPEGSDDQGVFWTIGNLQVGESRTHQFTAQVNQVESSGAQVEGKIKLWQMKTAYRRCGFLWLRRCGISTYGDQITETVQSYHLKTAQITTAKIKLANGYNFITLPYTMTGQDIAAFLSRLQTKWAWHYSAKTAEWLDLNQNENQNKIGPGIGFWIYDAGGTSYPLPDNRIALDAEASYSLDLYQGWNQLGNPYPKRIQFKGDKMMVRKGGSTETGEIKTYDEAVSYGWVSSPYVYKPSSSLSGLTSSAPTVDSSSYDTLTSGDYLDAYTGFYIEAMENVSIIYPGKSIFAPGELLTDTEKAKIDAWLTTNNLNECGNPKTPSDQDTSPLYDSTTGKLLDRYDCVVLNHPEREWLSE